MFLKSGLYKSDEYLYEPPPPTSDLAKILDAATSASNNTMYNGQSAAYWANTASDKASNALNKATEAANNATTAANRAQTAINQTIDNGTSVASWAHQGYDKANTAATKATEAAGSASTAANSAANAFDMLNSSTNGLAKTFDAATSASNNTMYNEQSAAYLAYLAANAPPTIQKLSGLNGATCVAKDGTFNVVVTATDNKAGQLQAQAKVDSGSYGAWVNIPQDTVSVTLPQGAHTITVQVKDAAGNMSTATMTAFGV